MTKRELESKLSELQSRIEYLEGALGSISEDGEELGLWAEAHKKRAARAKSEAAKSREQFPIKKEFAAKIQSDAAWVEQKKADLTAIGEKRAEQMKAIQFPITLDVALLKWMDDLDAADRRPIFKQFLRESLPTKPNGKPIQLKPNFHSNGPTPPLADSATVEAYLAGHSGKWIDESNWLSLSLCFDSWRHGYRERVKRERAEAAAKARWKKKV